MCAYVDAAKWRSLMEVGGMRRHSSVVIRDKGIPEVDRLGSLDALKHVLYSTIVLPLLFSSSLIRLVSTYRNSTCKQSWKA